VFALAQVALMPANCWPTELTRKRFTTLEAPEKTALLNFDASLLQGTGRPASKPATFTFLGFTHFRARTRKGTVHVGRTPSVKTRERFVAKIAEWLRINRHESVWEHQAHLTKALNGFYQYFGLRLCTTKLGAVRQRVQRLWVRALRRRSQRARRTTDWKSLNPPEFFGGSAAWNHAA
jgi:RNA-directed DNA polymerase